MGYLQQHTFLFRDAVWQAEGTFRDQEGNQHPAEGIVRVNHHRNIWNDDRVLKIKSEPLQEIFSFHEVTPIAEGSTYTDWQSQNPKLGMMKGRIIISGDEMFSAWVTDDGQYSGMEHMHRVSASHYRNDGYIFRGNQRLSSWEVNLKRI